MRIKINHIAILFLFFCPSCVPLGSLMRWMGKCDTSFSGSVFYKQAASFDWKQRDSLAMEWLLAGRVPSFLSRFEKVHVSITDSISGKIIRAYYYVSPDYVSVGADNDWARIPLTPMAAQKLADSLGCFLPTRKMVDDIYQQSKVKLEPMPLFAFRDSTPTLYHHHLMIEGQRQGRDGLIAGIKKDVVISHQLKQNGKPNRVAIYGWHKPDGKPIQPLYTGHINHYVDYSHGIRLVMQTIYVNKKPMNYTEVMKHPVYKRLLCDEANCDVFRYD